MKTKVFVGGVAGIETLMDSSSSTRFRFNGGGIYLHGSGWKKLDHEEKHTVVNANENAPIGIELGFGAGEAHDRAWLDRYKKYYDAYSISPDLILSNAFATRNVPLPQRWESFLQDFRDFGLTNPIYPTFEYQNFRSNMNILNYNTVSKRKDFQDIIRCAGGIAIDAPCRYMIEVRNKDYREWVVDALRWTKDAGLSTVMVASPYDSNSRFLEDAIRYVEFLISKAVIPETLIIENYAIARTPGYVPVVGREWVNDTCLGVGLCLIDHYFGGLK